MSDELKKQLETALSRIAALETARSPASTPTSKGIDPQQLQRAFMSDPVGTMKSLGLSVDHTTKVLVAHQLGDSAPPELRMLAQQGPLMSATQAITSDVHALRQRLDHYEERDRKDAQRTSFKALAADKIKYPTLAAAYAKNPALFETDAADFQGDVAALADKTEKYLSALSPQTASTENAGTDGQSSQAKAHVGGVDQTPPPISNSKPGVFTQETHEAVKARILAKYPTQSE